MKCFKKPMSVLKKEKWVAVLVIEFDKSVGESFADMTHIF